MQYTKLKFENKIFIMEGKISLMTHLIIIIVVMLMIALIVSQKLFLLLRK